MLPHYVRGWDPRRGWDQRTTAMNVQAYRPKEAIAIRPETRNPSWLYEGMDRTLVGR